MVLMALSQEHGVTVVPGLTENLDGDLHVEVDLTLTALVGHRHTEVSSRTLLLLRPGAPAPFRDLLESGASSRCRTADLEDGTGSSCHLDELLQLGAVLQLGVAVEQQGGVVGVGQGLAVEGLQVRCEVVDPLGIQEFPDDIRRLQLPDGSEQEHRG